MLSVILINRIFGLCDNPLMLVYQVAAWSALMLDFMVTTRKLKRNNFLYVRNFEVTCFNYHNLSSPTVTVLRNRLT